MNFKELEKSITDKAEEYLRLLRGYIETHLTSSYIIMNEEDHKIWKKYSFMSLDEFKKLKYFLLILSDKTSYEGIWSLPEIIKKDLDDIGQHNLDVIAVYFPDLYDLLDEYQTRYM